MKYFIVVTFLLLIFSCKTQPKSQSITITSDEVKDMVSYLASDDLEGRYTGSEGIEKAADYIESKFKSFDVKPYFETYRDNFKIGDSINAFNVVGFVEGSDEKLKDELIIIGAHYDHIGYGDDARKKSRNIGITKADSIANGANDNASGTSAVMAMAKYFATTKSNKRSIIFALFSAEEFGLFGSKHLAKRLKSDNIDLYTMLAFEMIGVPLMEKEYDVFLSGYELSNMANKMNEYTNSNLIGLSEISIRNNLFRRSDNFPFYEQFNVACQTMSSCDLSNYDYYHHVDDETNELDYEFMANVIHKAIIAVEQMSNTPTKEIKMYESE